MQPSAVKSVILRHIGGPEVLEVVEQAAPQPAPNEVLIRTRAIAVSRPDILIRNGSYAWSPPLPANPGNEMTGVIEEVGSAVRDLRPGQAVLLSSRELPQRGGCYTELRAVPATAVHLLPEGVDLEQAVVLPSWLVAHAMLTRLGHPASPRSIFVNGVTGTIGSALASLAKASGFFVVGSVGSDSKEADARAAGVDHIVRYPNAALAEAVREGTGGRGVDIAFDHVIGEGFIECVRMLADFGTAVAYNVFSPMPAENVFGELRRLSLRSLGVRVFNVHTFDHDLPALRAMTAELIAMLAERRISPKIGKRFPLTQAAQAHREMEAGGVSGKIILLPDSGPGSPHTQD